MSMLRKWESRVRRWWYGDQFRLWYHPDYRLPIPSLESHAQIEPRRADLVMWHLLDVEAIEQSQIERPRRVSVRDMARVHDCGYLESLTQSDVLATIFGVPWRDIPVDEALRTVRLACGATLQAARDCLAHEGIALNALGGFHHAWPERGARMCPINDIAIAIEAIRDDGWKGQVVILDLDAHPPDGLAACLTEQPDVWIGSLSGCDWGPLVGVDETVLPSGCGDKAYVDALRQLLKRMPVPGLAFVIAGGDVLDGDHSGGLGLSLQGARARDALVCDALAPCPTVWLPGGGYHRDAWRVLAGSGLYLATRSSEAISPTVEPLRRQFRKIAEGLHTPALDGEPFLTEEDLHGVFKGPTKELRYLLDFYTVDGIELALYQFGILNYVKRLGYHHPEIKIAKAAMGDRFQLWGQAEGEPWLLIEAVLEKAFIEGQWMLYIHWLTLRHPRGEFAKERVALPGQEVPGLGLAKEASEMLSLIAKRLQLGGVAYRPSWFHVAYSLRRRFRFVAPERQGRFEALIRDLAALPLEEVTQCVAQEQVLLDGKPYEWEAEAMVFMPSPTAEYTAKVDATRESTRFALSPASSLT